MPIGLVSDDDFLKELNKSNSTERIPSVKDEIITPEIVELEKKGRKEGDVNVPDPLRQIIAEEQLLNGRPAALKLASQFGISASSVSAYANGATSTKTYDSPSKSLIGHINKSRERATRKASKTLNAALSAITQDKLDYADATDLSGIAKDMSVIIKNLEPKSVQSDDGPQTPQFVIFAPSFRQENSFETIEVKE